MDKFRQLLVQTKTINVKVINGIQSKIIQMNQLDATMIY